VCPRCGRAWRMKSSNARSSCFTLCGVLRAAPFSGPTRPALGRSGLRMMPPPTSLTDSPRKIHFPLAHFAARSASSNHDLIRRLRGIVDVMTPNEAVEKVPKRAILNARENAHHLPHHHEHGRCRAWELGPRRDCGPIDHRRPIQSKKRSYRIVECRLSWWDFFYSLNVPVKARHEAQRAESRRSRTGG